MLKTAYAPAARRRVTVREHRSAKADDAQQHDGDEDLRAAGARSASNRRADPLRPCFQAAPAMPVT